MRTYAAIEGNYDVPALAEAHGLKVWQGIWLGADRAQNAREIARAIELAHLHPTTVDRLIVGNEVLLRRDLPVDELIAAIDQVRAAVKQPVTYADVWEFWEQFPEVAAHVDSITIHLLPYWEDVPTGIDRAFLHVEGTYARIVSEFPGKPVVVGEVGWPSRGRWRGEAAPGPINQTAFIRRVIISATQRNIDYCVLEAFDQGWKYRSEGTVGANWGLWTQDRQPKFTFSGPVSFNPRWLEQAMLAAALSLLLLALGLATPGLVVMSQLRLGLLATALGTALGWAICTTLPVLYDTAGWVAAFGNLAGQSLLAVLLVRRIATAAAGWDVPAPRSYAQATARLRDLLRLRRPNLADGLLDDLTFLFAWTATVLQLLLLFDPRYRDFPFATFAVPLVVVVARLALFDLARAAGGRLELWLGTTLALAALASALREEPVNLQAWAWASCALAPRRTPAAGLCAPLRRSDVRPAGDPGPGAEAQAEHPPGGVVVDHARKPQRHRRPHHRRAQQSGEAERQAGQAPDLEVLRPEQPVPQRADRRRRHRRAAGTPFARLDVLGAEQQQRHQPGQQQQQAGGVTPSHVASPRRVLVPPSSPP